MKKLNMKKLSGLVAKKTKDSGKNPKVRKMLRVTVDDALEAEKVFAELMGDDVLPRKDFIHKNAKFVKNLDI